MVTHQSQSANDEGRAVLAAIQDIPATAPTACSAWTAHELVAHLAAGAKESADLIEAKLEGRPDRPTRGFNEREAPFRTLDHEELTGRLVEENRRKLRAQAALAAHPDPSIAFTGTHITVDQLVTHSRSEAAIHRWDLVGDDQTSRQLLSQPDLTAHALWVLNAMPVLNESAHSLGTRAAGAGHPRATIALRSPGQADVVLWCDPSGSRFETVTGCESADLAVAMSAHHRLLVLWGRRPSQLDAAIDGDPRLQLVLDEILWPQAKPWS